MQLKALEKVIEWALNYDDIVQPLFPRSRMNFHAKLNEYQRLQINTVKLYRCQIHKRVSNVCKQACIIDIKYILQHGHYILIPKYLW